MTDEVHYRTCPLCEATCGLELTMRDGTVVRVRRAAMGTYRLEVVGVTRSARVQRLK